MAESKAEVSYFKVRVNGPEFSKGNDAADTIIAPGIPKTDVERQVPSPETVMSSEVIKPRSMGDNGGNRKKFQEGLFIMEGQAYFRKGMLRNFFRNTGLAVRSRNLEVKEITESSKKLM